MARRKALSTQLEMWYKRKEEYWRQMSRDKYLMGIYRKTQCFYFMVAAKARKKMILKVRMRRRTFQNKEIWSFSKEIYSQSVRPIISFPENLVRRISMEEAVWLESPPSTSEVKKAVWDYDPLKAPGYDGYNLNFIRRM